MPSSYVALGYVIVLSEWNTLIQSLHLKLKKLNVFICLFNVGIRFPHFVKTLFLVFFFKRQDGRVPGLQRQEVR